MRTPKNHQHAGNLIELTQERRFQCECQHNCHSDCHFPADHMDLPEKIQRTGKISQKSSGCLQKEEIKIKNMINVQSDTYFNK